MKTFYIRFETYYVLNHQIVEMVLTRAMCKSISRKNNERTVLGEFAFVPSAVIALTEPLIFDNILRHLDSVPITLDEFDGQITYLRSLKKVFISKSINDVINVHIADYKKRKEEYVKERTVSYVGAVKHYLDRVERSNTETQKVDYAIELFDYIVFNKEVLRYPKFRRFQQVVLNKLEELKQTSQLFYKRGYRKFKKALIN